MIRQLRSRTIPRTASDAGDSSRPKRRRKRRYDAIDDNDHGRFYDLDALFSPTESDSVPGPRIREIYSSDFGTTYATAARVVLRDGKSGTEIDSHDIHYISEYKSEVNSSSSSNNIAPCLLYYPNDENQALKWGWEVHGKLHDRDEPIHHYPDHVLGAFKLLYDNSDCTIQWRQGLQGQLDRLKKNKRITMEDDVFENYLVHWFGHIREKCKEDTVDRPEFVVCVPSAWSMSSSDRWVKSFQRAIQKLWPAHSPTYPPKIYTITEPAAAASYYLWNHHQIPRIGDFIIVIDGGGGTIEVITYEKTMKGYRLVGNPSSLTCGGNSVNEALRRVAIEKIESQRLALEGPGKPTIEIIVEADVIREYELNGKRLNPGWDFEEAYPFKVGGLTPDHTRGIGLHKLTITKEEWREIWRPSLDGLEKLLGEQYDQIQREENGSKIRDVAWVGQFCNSTLLRSRGKKVMAGWSSSQIRHLHEPACSQQSVAGGGILGYLHQDEIYTTTLRASLAYMCDIPRPWDNGNERQEALREVAGDSKWEFCQHAKFVKGKDGQHYPMQRLQWFAQAGDEFTKPFTYISRHFFPVKDLEIPWSFSEGLWYSPSNGKKSGYSTEHHQNKDAIFYGRFGALADSLKDYKEHLLIVEEGRNAHYEVCLEVSVKPLSGFRHEFRIRAAWVPGKDFKGETMEVWGTDMNAACVFELTAR